MPIEDIFTTSQDGLKLHARRWGAAVTTALPVVCLPGLARTTADFDDIAEVLSADGRRAVYAFDYRGRGQSDFDKNWRNYDLKIEIADILDQMTALQIGQAVFFGTSRGGMLTMLAGMLRPNAVKGAILNDIGAVIDGKGLARIRSYVGKMPKPRSYNDGAEMLKRIASSQFTNLSEEGWLTFARRTWTEKNGALVPLYDPALMKTLELLDLEAPLPELWPQFAALNHVPVLLLRGAHSDILSRQTAEEMVARHPNCQLYEAPYEGHAPMLMDSASQKAVADFVNAAAP